MEIAVLMFILGFMLVGGIVAGLLGFALSSVLLIVKMIVTYLLPGLLAGILLTKLTVRYRTWDSYKYRCIPCMIISLALLFVWLKQPAQPEVIDPAQVAQMTVKSTEYFSLAEKERTYTTDNRDVIDLFCRSLQFNSATHSLKDLMHQPTTGETTYSVELTDPSGETVARVDIYNDETIRVKTGIFYRYYKGWKAYSDTRLAASLATKDEAARELDPSLRQFAGELFDSIVYLKDGQIAFTIPETLPAGEYKVQLVLYGVPDGESDLREMTVFKEEQRKNTWIPGQSYSFPVTDYQFSGLRFEVHPGFFRNTLIFDAMELLPQELHYKR